MIHLLNLFMLSYMLPSAKQMPTILFFTGGNSLMPKDIYSNFLSKFKDKYNVEIIKNTNKDSETIIDQLFEYSTNDEIIPMGHSSGCTTLLNYCTKMKNIKKCILLDPVDNNLKKNDNYNFDSFLRINAEKSYKWKMGDNVFKNPLPKIPFIPFFNMDTSNFKNVTKVNLKDYGHCDILDTAFSNIMHNTFAEGNSDRNNLDNYHKLLYEIIDNYINDYKKTEYEGINIEFK